MFTGLVEAIGRMDRRSGAAGARARVRTSLGPLVLGESVSVEGVCLTVDRIHADGFEADMSEETLARSTLGSLEQGARVHLERATPVGGRLGGHMVLGHVDGIGRVVDLAPAGAARRLTVRAPGELARFLAPKGSIAVRGVSLTVNGVRDAGSEVVFDVMLVPHTLESTALGDLHAGVAVNLEVDVLARYVARALDVGSRATPAESPHGEYGAGETNAVDDQDERLLAKLRAGGYA